MDNFDKRFDEHRKEFDRDFRRIKMLGIVAFVVSTTFGLSLIGIIIWVVVMTMQFFGIV